MDQGWRRIGEGERIKVSKDSSSIHFGSVHALFILPSLAMSSTINRVNEKSRTKTEVPSLPNLPDASTKKRMKVTGRKKAQGL